MSKQVAVVFWGITRSLKNTVKSIESNIFKPLHEMNLEYKTFVHTYFLDKTLSNPRAGENNEEINNMEYTLLNPDYIMVENEETVKTECNFNKYRSQYDYYDTNYKNIDNFIWAMYSKKQVCKMVANSGKTFDYILICRPDVIYETPITLQMLEIANDATIAAPSFHVFFRKINDRFFILTQSNLQHFGNLFDELYEFSRDYPIHPEQFIYEFLVNKYSLDIIYIPFMFNRLRANNKLYLDTLDLNGKMPSFKKAERGLPYEYHWRSICGMFPKDRILWITLINIGYIEYTKNFLKSMEKTNCKFRLLVLCMDHDTVRALKDFSNCMCLLISSLGLKNIGVKQLCDYTTPEYTELVYLKLDVTRLMLNKVRPFGLKYVGFIDTDIILLSDPTPIILDRMKEHPTYNIFSQCNEQTLCTNLLSCPKINTGVIVYRNIPEVADLLKYTEADVARYRATQAFIMDKFKRLNVKHITIDTDIFLNGSYPELQNGKPIEIPPNAVLIHYNWVIDINYKKIQLMKEQGQWYL